MGSVKAMLSDNNGINTTTGLPGNLNGRQACFGDCRSTSLYVLDWVIAANQRYCTNDYSTKVGDSGVTYPALYVTEANVLAASATTTYNGFNIYYGNSTTNCSSWTSTAGTFVAGSTDGIFTGNSNSFITGAGFVSCATAASIVCVEQ